LRRLSAGEYGQEKLANLEQATTEYLASILSQPDQWSSHYNLGNYFLDLGDANSALKAYETALRMEPRAVLTKVNASIGHSRLGDMEQAEGLLRSALRDEPKNAPAHFNLGLLLAEKQANEDAKLHLRKAVQFDPQMGEAAYNLGILTAKDQPEESVEWLLKAFELNKNPKYGYTLAYYMRERGDSKRAINTLEMVLEQWPYYVDAYFLLGEIYEQSGQVQDAEALYQRGGNNEAIGAEVRYHLRSKWKELKSKQIED
jgi:Tfp pilus assembly protein PilF